MPSFNNPKVTNPINSDISEIRELLQILAKHDYTGVDDTPTGAKRITTVTGGMQLQNFSNNSWSSIGKLMHDVDKLDGYHASTTAVKNTIPVYNANAQLVGNLTGNAATSTKLKTARTIDVGGIASATEQKFDGSGNITIPINSINVANDDDNALVGVVSKAHGGTGRTDGAATDVILSNGGKASEYGQIGDSKRIDGYDLNSLVVNGIYLARGGTVENHFPREIPTASCVTVYVSRSASHILQILCEASGDIWQRRSADSGATWLPWNCSSYPAGDTVTFYISKSGSDNNTGLTSDMPLLTLSKALSLADKIHSNGGSYVMFFVGEGDWGNLKLRALPYHLQIFSYSGDTATQYSDSLPHFSTIIAENTILNIGSIVCDFLDSNANSTILISRKYNRIGTFRARHGGIIEIDGGASAVPIDIISRTNHDYVYNTYNFGCICHLGNRTMNIVENLTLSGGFLFSNTHSDISMNGATIKTQEGVTVTGAKYIVKKSASISGIDDLDSLPGTSSGVKDVGAIIDGIPYGGGASDEALMADLSWKPVLLQTGGKVSGELQLERNQIPLAMIMSDIEWGVTPSSDKFSGISIYEKTKTKRLGFFQCAERASGQRVFEVAISNDNEKAVTDSRLRLVYDKNKSIYYATAPTPPSDAKSTEIATASWVNTKLSNYLLTTEGTVNGRINFNLYGTDDYIGTLVANNDSYGKRLILDTYEEGDSGAYMALRKGSDTINPGGFEIKVRNSDGSVVKSLEARTNGNLSWDGKQIVRSVNGATADSTGNVKVSNVSGNAATATKLKTKRTITVKHYISGTDKYFGIAPNYTGSGSASFDGSGNITIRVPTGSYNTNCNCDNM